MSAKRPPRAPEPMTTPALDGVRVLDLASVGPGARASRILADYGADVVKVGAVPRAGAIQIIPPFYAYSGNRGMARALFDLKDAGGREAFLALADEADVIIESFRPGVVDKLGVGYAAVGGRNGGHRRGELVVGPGGSGYEEGED